MSEMDLLRPADKEILALRTRLVERRCAVRWSIDNFSAFKFESYGEIESPAFHCFSSTWALHLYPKGENSKDGFSNISLKRLSPHTNQKMVNFKFGIGNLDNSYYSWKEGSVLFNFNNNSSEIECQTREFIAIADLYNLMFNDTLTLYCELFSYESEDGERESLEKQAPGKTPIQEDDGPWTVSEGAETLANDMQVLLRDRKNCDVTLQVGEDKFPAHKVLLMARSSVFAAMLEHDVEESRSNTITIADLDAAVVGDMLEYIYSGNVSDITVDKALGLYAAADKYALMELKSRCCKFLLRNLSVENACDIAVLADAHNDGVLVDSVKVFARENTSLLSTEKWRSLAKQNSYLAYEITLGIAFNG